MKRLHDTYVRFGDRARRAARIRRGLYTGAVVIGGLLALALRPPKAAIADDAPPANGFSLSLGGERRMLRDSIEVLRGQLDLASAQVDRANTVIRYSTHYGIAADLAGDIVDVSQAEGIEPELAFRLVKIESDFNEHATSPVGAVGLTQLMLGTARDFDRPVTRETLYARTTNLRIGFRYLRSLIGQYKGDVNLALLVYNRGEGAVSNSRTAGRDPSNGYDRAVMRGYHGRAIVN